MPDDVVPTRMLPKLTDANRAFWTGGANGDLLVQHCDACDRWLLPPVEACPACGGAVTVRPVSGRGTVFTYTTNYHQFHPDVPPPNLIAIVTLDEQDDLRLMTNLIGCTEDDVASGSAVQVRFEDHGEVFYPVFELSGQNR
ncbi:MAG TPA: OB-fold domain-containing protein [Mycobacteriales bacterium]|nr:OB-fold domain-containing protein [Mycobacteriales bacterium]